MRYRIHATFTVKEIKWSNNATKFAPYKTSKCLYCPFGVICQRKIRSLTKFCADNSNKLTTIEQYKNRDAREVYCASCNKRLTRRNSFYKHNSRHHPKQKLGDPL